MLRDGRGEARKDPHSLSILSTVWPPWHERLTCPYVSIPDADRPGSTRHEHEGARDNGCKGQERRSRCVFWSQHAPSRPRQSDIAELSLCEGKEARHNALQRSPDNLGRNMKQVSVESNLRHEHPPPMSFRRWEGHHGIQGIHGERPSAGAGGAAKQRRNDKL